MTKLTQINMKFDWSEKAKAVFQQLKQRLCSAPILALPEGSKNFVVYCDASRKGLGAVLIAKGESHSLRITPTQDSREELHHTRLKTWRSGICSQNVETLSVRYEVRCVH
ncbi:putative reverse transcriptase domain-containing protein [Tanacetum coccineum]